MTHILLFAPLYPPYSGGSPTYFSNLVDSLSEEHTFTVVTAYHPDKPIIMESNGNTIYRVIPFCQSLPNLVRLLLESLTAFAVSLYLVLFRSIESAHIHATSYASPAIAVAASIANVPIIYDCQDLSFPPWIVNIGSQPLMFSCSPNVDEILKQEDIPESRIVRVPIVNPEYVAQHANEMAEKSHSDEFIIIYVGNLREFKGVGILMKSFRRLLQKRDGARLKIVGDGPYEATLRRDIDGSGLEDNVEFMGEISHEDALGHIARSDVLVHPSARETGPRSVTEAIELGTTVVATPVGIVPEIIEDEQTGLITSRDVDDITESLISLYDDRTFLEELSKNAMNCDNSLEWENIVGIVSDIYIYSCS